MFILILVVTSLTFIVDHFVLESSLRKFLIGELLNFFKPTRDWFQLLAQIIKCSFQNRERKRKHIIRLDETAAERYDRVCKEYAEKMKKQIFYTD